MQSEQALDLFDSILLSQTVAIEGKLISRDKHRFLHIVRQ